MIVVSGSASEGLSRKLAEALSAQLVGVEYQRRADGSVQLERKKDMKKRGLASPDLGDALALTFAQPVRAKSEIEEYAMVEDKVVTDYDIFGD